MDATVEEPSGQIGRRERKKAATREAIYEAAVTLFREEGYEETSVDEVARRAGVSRATVFNYYGTKNALLIEYRRRLDAELRESEERLLATDPDPAGSSARRRVEDFFAELAVLAKREDALYRSLVRKVLTQLAHLDEDDHERSERVARSLATALRHGMDSDEIRSDLDPEMAAYTLLRLWTSALLEWTNTGGESPLAQRVKEMVGLLFEGMEAPEDGLREA